MALDQAETLRRIADQAQEASEIGFKVVCECDRAFADWIAGEIHRRSELSLDRMSLLLVRQNVDLSEIELPNENVAIAIYGDTNAKKARSLFLKIRERQKIEYAGFLPVPESFLTRIQEEESLLKSKWTKRLDSHLNLLIHRLKEWAERSMSIECTHFSFTQIQNQRSFVTLNKTGR